MKNIKNIILVLLLIIVLISLGSDIYIHSDLMLPSAPVVFHPIHPLNLQDGDLILFSAKHSWWSKLIISSALNKWTHVALVVFVNGKPNIWQTRLGSNTKISSYKNLQKRYPGNVAIRRIKTPIPNATLLNAISKYKDVPFPESIYQLKLLQSSLFKNIIPSQKDRYSTLYCSQLIAVTLLDCGISIPEKWQNITPSDFSSKHWDAYHPDILSQNSVK